MQTGESSHPDSAFLNRSLGSYRQTSAIRWQRRTLLAGCFAALLAGCGFARQEVLETRLREHEATVRRLESELAATRKTVSEQDRLLLSLRSAGPGSGDKNPLDGSTGTTALVSAGRPVGVAWGDVTELRIHGLTAGILRPEDGGPATLNVVVQPLDDDGEVVKAAGELTVNLSTLPTGDSPPTVIVERRLSITECRSTWSRGLVASGFHVQLPIDDATMLPNDGARVLVTATLDLGPGRELSNSRIIDSHR